MSSRLRPAVVPALLSVALLACGDRSRGADCEPVSGGGCDARERCTVDGDGEPACVTGGGALAVGASCARVKDCGAGSACVQIDGRATCLAFCAAEGPAGAATCRGAVDDPARAARSRCLAAVAGHPEIGLCVEVCDDPAAPEAACGGEVASACYLPAGLDVAVCSGVPATAAERGRCGPDRRCPVGTLCVPEGASGVCRLAAAKGVTPACAEATYEVELAGAPAYRACAPCRVVAGPLAGEAEDIRYSACAAVLDAASAAAECEAEGGALVRRAALPEEAAVALATGAAELAGGPLRLTDACFQPETGAFEACDAGHPLCRVPTAR